MRNPFENVFKFIVPVNIMEYVRERVLTFLRVVVWYLDYLIYIIFNPFKFKPLPKNIRRILIIEIKYIGDIIATTPAIHAIKNTYKSAEIDIVVPEIMRGLLKNNPDISKILTFDNKTFSENLAMIKNKYDLSIIFHNGTFKTSLLLFLARIRFRTGCTKVGITESKGYFLHRNTRPTFELKHKIYDNLDVIKTINISRKDIRLHLYTDNVSDKKINKLLEKNNIRNKDNLIIIHPNPQHKSHEWFQDRFAKLSDILVERFKARIVFSGSKKDFDYNDKIIKLMKKKALNLAGTSLPEFVSLINRSKLVISVDTGAMHISAALNKPTISLFGAGNPKIWKPYCGKSFVIFKEYSVHTSCMKHNCYLKNERHMECMKSINVNDVLKQIKAIL